MSVHIILLVAARFIKKSLRSPMVWILMGIFLGLCTYAGWSSWEHYEHESHIREAHQQKARQSWENNPDKHPHRMAHFGTFAFRVKHPLSVFDQGLESYMGNALFLEAHAQNSVHFSEASLSSGLVRLGKLDMAMILQSVFPLILLCLGYRTIVEEREQGTLKLMLLQGAPIRSVCLGKVLGLFGLALLFLLPLGLWTLGLQIFWSPLEHSWTPALLVLGYLLYVGILCHLIVWISLWSKRSNTALLRLLGLWILWVLILPKTVQNSGKYLYPAPNTYEFKSQLQEELEKIGNSHNPNDPYFSAIRDSVLAAHQVDDVRDLPFNYGGFIMGVGEKISSKIYADQHQKLLNIYRQQNGLSFATALVDPYLAIRLYSQICAQTDFETYADFKRQAEDYRYALAQRMNQLQMDLISSQRPQGSEGKQHVVSRRYWKEFPDFQYQFSSDQSIFKKLQSLLWILLSWEVFCCLGLLLTAKRSLILEL